MSLSNEINTLNINKINIRDAIAGKGIILESPNDMSTYASAINGIVVGTRNVGEIVKSTIPLVDAGLHLLDGSVIVGGGIYDAFVTYMAGLYGDGTAIPDYFCTEADWQTSVTTYGVCGKFVYNSVNRTVRLPKITGFTEGTITPAELGDLTEAGLPNITGSFDLGTSNNTIRTESNAYSATGAISAIKGSNNNGSSSSGYGLEGFTFDASLSNSIYGNSTTVQPQSIKVLYYIVVANTTEGRIKVDINEIATDLNSKADVDLVNINSSGYIKMSGAGMPSDTYDDLTLGSTGATYTAPANGYFAALGSSTATGQYLNFYVFQGTTRLMNDCRRSTGSGQYMACYIPVMKGYTLQFEYSVPISTFRFIYAKGSESEAS